MSHFSSYHSIAQYAPGSYICSLERYHFSSLAEKEQSKAIIHRLNRIDFSPKAGEAWFPIIRSHQEHEVFGVILSINTHKKGTPLAAEDQTFIRVWLSKFLDNIPVEIPPLYLSNLPPDWSIKGSSWGLSALIAVISSLLQEETPSETICSGVLCSTLGVLSPVSAPNEKKILCSWEAPNVQPIIITQRCSIENIFDTIFVKDWKNRLLLRLKMTPRSLAEEALNQYRQRNSSTAYRMASNVLDMECESLIPKILAYFILGSVEKHNGNSLESIQHLTKARELILQCSETDQIDFYLRFRLEANLGIAMLQNLQISSAIIIMERGLRELTSIQPYHRDLNWHSVSLRVAGTLRWLYIANGEPLKAKDIQLFWPLSRARIPQHLCRAEYSLADIYWRLGDLEEAQKHYELAKIMFSDVRPVERDRTLRYLLLCGMRIGKYPIKAKPLCWPNALIDQLETLEFALQSNQLSSLFDHLKPIPDDITTLFVISGFMARSIELYGYDSSFDPFVTQMAKYYEKMPPNMKEAFHKLTNKDGSAWARIAPY